MVGAVARPWRAFRGRAVAEGIADLRRLAYALLLLWVAVGLTACGDFEGDGVEAEAGGAEAPEAAAGDPAAAAFGGADDEAAAEDEPFAAASGPGAGHHLPAGAPIPSGSGSPFEGPPAQHEPIEPAGDRPAPEFVPAGGGAGRRAGSPRHFERERPPPDAPQEDASGGDRFDSEARMRAGDRPDCIICGRETGFLGRPELSVEVGPDKVVRLTWSAVDGADFYTVTGISSAYDDAVFSTMTQQWRTVANHLTLVLPEDRRYTFTVMAWRGEPKARSVASNPVLVEL